jgi:hypothetical protein
VWFAAAVALVLVLAGGAFALWSTNQSDDEGDGDNSVATSAPLDTDDGSEVTDPTDPTATTLVAPSSSQVPQEGVVDLGQGVRYALPAGFTQSAVGSGVEITDGRLRFYAQVSNRTPGEDPLAVVQEYIDGFDSLYASGSYSQAIPEPIDSSGVSDADGYIVYYRVMAADGTGYKGVLDATRRADGLVYVTDLYTPLDDAPGVVLPAGVADELYASFLQTPVIGAEVELAALPITRLTSVHPELPLDGVVSVTPPAGWNIDLPGPQRVIVSHPLGERFVAARLADTLDFAIAQQESAQDLAASWPGATMTPFATSRDSGPVLSFDAGFTAIGLDGLAVDGVVRVWFDPATGRVFHAIASGLTGVAPQPGNRDFLFSALDIALTQPH